MNWKSPLSRSYTLSDCILIYLIISVAYRFSMLTEALLNNRIWIKEDAAVMLLGFFDDLLMGMLIVSLFFLLHQCVRKARINTILLAILLTTVAVIYTVNKKLFLILSIHLSLNNVASSWDNGFTFHYFLPFMHVADWMLIFLPVCCLVLLKFTTKKFADCLLYYGVSTVIIVSLTFSTLLLTMQSIPLRLATNIILYPNPIHFMLSNVADVLLNPYARAKDKPNDAQMQSIALVDPSFVTHTRATEIPLTGGGGKQWNIVFVVMESVGYSYVSDGTKEHDNPMPFLHSLAEKGWWFTQQYSSGNNSPIGAFGLFSGIYPSPMPTHAMMRSDIRIPNLATWLGPTYHSFFVTPADTHLYFPRAFMQNTGFNHFYDSTNLPIKNKQYIYGMYVNDYLALDFLLTHIEQEKKPFLAVYWPCATHYPYVPYAKGKQVVGDDSPYAHYVNNLNIIDDQLHKIVTFLEQKN